MQPAQEWHGWDLGVRSAGSRWEVPQRSQDGRTETLCRAKTSQEAIAAAEHFVTQQRADIVPLVAVDTRWRRTPASDKQLAYLRRMNIGVPKGLTKSQASHIIGMLSIERMAMQ